MTAAEKMVEIFRQNFPDFIIEAGSYGGGAERYATYEERCTGDGYADDRPQYDRVRFELILYAPKNDKLRIKLRTFRQELNAKGFGWPELVRDGNAMQQQWLLIFEGAEVVEWES